jgi:KDO2-lipid IV(A) lauroyltransferase
VPDFYFIPKRLARKTPALVALAQRIEGAGFRLLFWLIQKLPLEAASRLAAFVFGLVGPHTDKARKAHENLAIAFPESSEQWRRQTVRDIFRHLGYSAVELLKLDQIWRERDRRIEVVMQPRAREHMASGRATVFFTAHLGPWQVANLVPRQYGFRNNTLYAPESNPVLRGLMLELRSAFGGELIPADAGARPMIKTLRAGDSISMAADTRPDAGKLVPFFGRDALTSTITAGIALHSGVPLVPVRGERLPGCRYRFTVFDPLVAPDPDAPQKEQALALTAQINRLFEEWIREHPEQWICLKRRWPKAHKL